MKNLVILLLLLSGCAQATGPAYSPSAIERGKAQIVVYETSAIKKTSQVIDINGIKACDLVQGGYFVKNVLPGNITISSSIWDIPGTSKLIITTQVGKRYYVNLQYDVLAGMNKNGGPFVITEESTQIAESAINSLRGMTCNE